MGIDRIDESQTGQAMAEYAIVLGVILLAVVALFTLLSGAIATALQSVTARL